MRKRTAEHRHVNIEIGGAGGVICFQCFLHAGVYFAQPGIVKLITHDNERVTKRIAPYNGTYSQTYCDIYWKYK